jgi:hypothetical protein
MSKCSKCQNDFIPLLKSDGLPYKTCDRCKCTDKKYRDKHKEQRKEYREANKEHTKEYGIYLPTNTLCVGPLCAVGRNISVHSLSGVDACRRSSARARASTPTPTPTPRQPIVRAQTPSPPKSPAHYVATPHSIAHLLRGWYREIVRQKGREGGREREIACARAIKRERRREER